MNTDGQVAELFVVANQNEIAVEQMAAERAYIPAVREFAQQRLSEQNRVLEETAVVFEDEGFGRAATDDSRALSADNAINVQNLATYNDVMFDRAFLRSVIAQHRWAIDFIDQRLLPTAHDDDLEDLLTRTRPVEVEHLRQAEAMLASLR